MEHDSYFEEFKTIMSNFFKEEEKTFDVWFQKMKDQLSEDAAGNLQVEIDNLNEIVMDAISPITTEVGEILATENGEYIVAGL